MRTDRHRLSVPDSRVRVAVAVVAVGLLAVVAGAMAGSAVDSAAGENVTVGSDSEAVVADDPATIRLVTGERVTVRETGGQLAYQVAAAAGEYETTDTASGFYLLPERLDADSYDRELFNVTRLATEGLYDPETGAIPVVVTFDTDREDGTVDGLSGLELSREFDLVDGAAGTFSPDAGPLTDQKLADAGIDTVFLDRQLETTVDESPEEIRAPTARDQFDVDGTGINISVIDTGVDTDHPDVGDRVVLEENFVDDEETTDDLDGHGTHVAGTAAGDGTESGGDLVGIAPGANVLDMRACGADGTCTVSGLIGAVDSSVDNGADIISMSLGGPLEPDNPLNDAVDSAVDGGAVAITSAGNSGPGFESITAPGNAERAIAVAADDTLDRFYGEDVAQFSSRGPTAEFAIKPAVTAPGVLINASGSGDAGEFPYTTKSGTSMSAPHVSGLVALMLEANPDMTPAEVRSALVTTADRLETAAAFNEDLDADVYSSGAGQANATGALDPAVFVDRPQVGFEFDTLDDFGEERTEAVTVENIENETQTLSVEAELEHVEGDADGVFEVNRTALELDPGESTPVGITINASADRPGLYSGYLTLVDDSGVNHTAATFGYDQPVDVDDAIAVEKLPLDTRDVEGESLNLQTPEGEDSRQLEFDEDGFAFFQPDPEAESYTLITRGRDAATSDPIIVADVIEDPNATDGITLDENEAEAYQFNTSDIEAERGELLNRMVSASAASQTENVLGETFPEFGLTSIGVGLNHTGTAYFAGPEPDEYDDPEAVYFEFQHIAVPEATHEPLSTGGIQNDRVYNLLTWTQGEDGPVTVPYSEDDLRAIEATYSRDDPDTLFRDPVDEAGSTFLAAPLFEPNTEFGIGGPALTTFTHELGTQTEQTYFHNVDDTVSELALSVDYADTVYDGIEYSLGPTRTFDADPVTETHEYNVHPSPPAVDDEFGTVINPTNIYQAGPLYADTVDGDPQGYETGSFDEDNSYRVIHEGTVLEEEAVGESYEIFIDDEMPDLENGDLVEIELEADALAPIQRHETRYATEYHEDDENEPPEFQSVELETGAFNNGTAGTVEAVVEVTDHVTGVPDEFEAFYADGGVDTTPFEDGDGWTAADVEHLGDGVYAVSAQVSDEALSLSLALTAVDNEGSLVETTIYDIGTWSALEAPAFDVDLAGTNSPVEEGEALAVDIAVTNVGTEAGSETITLDAGGLGSNATTVSLDDGETTTETLSLPTAAGDAGSYVATAASETDSDSGFAVVAPPLPPSVVGDVNEDGEVGLTDAILHQEHVAGLEPSPFNENLADLTRDGEAGLTDAILLQERVAGIAQSGTVEISNATATASGDELTVTATLSNPGDIGTVQGIELRLAEAGEPLDANTTVAIEATDLAPDTAVSLSVTVNANHLTGDSYEYGLFSRTDSETGTVVLSSETTHLTRVTGAPVGG